MATVVKHLMAKVVSLNLSPGCHVAVGCHTLSKALPVQRLAWGFRACPRLDEGRIATVPAAPSPLYSSCSPTASLWRSSWSTRSMLDTCLYSSTHTPPSMRCAAWTSRCSCAILSPESLPCPPLWKVSAALASVGSPGLCLGRGEVLGVACSALCLDQEEALWDPSWEPQP